MRIKVNVSKITYHPIIEYYNFHKEKDEEPLEALDRMEGGFYIFLPKPINYNNGYIDFNDTVRQLRWSRNTLHSIGFINFTDKQIMLLYESMVMY